MEAVIQTVGTSKSKSLADVLLEHLGNPGLYPDYNGLRENYSFAYGMASDLAKYIREGIMEKKNSFLNDRPERRVVDNRVKLYWTLKVIGGGITNHEIAALLIGKKSEKSPRGIFVRGLGDLNEGYQYMAVIGDDVFYYDRFSNRFLTRKIQTPQDMYEVANSVTEVKLLKEDGQFEFSTE